MKHKKGFKALAAAVLSVSLLIGLVPATVFAATTAVTYVDENGDTHETTSYTRVDSIDENNYTLNTGWYVFGDMTESPSKRIAISGDVTIIVDGYVKLDKGIQVPQGSSLTIYKGVEGSGALFIEAPEAGYAGIGGDIGQVNGEITINSISFLNVNGGNSGEKAGAAIGTGAYAPLSGQGKISINGGKLNLSAPGAAAIGGGNKSASGEVEVYDSAKISAGNSSNSNDKPVRREVSSCTQFPYVEIVPCSHENGYEAVKVDASYHIMTCKTCRVTDGDLEAHSYVDGQCICGAESVAYSVTFVNGEETLGTLEVISGSVISSADVPPVTPPEGKVLAGWRIEGTNDFFDIENDVVTGAITLVATFDEALLATIVESEVVFEGALKIAFGFNFTDELMALTGAKVVFKKGDEVVSSIALEDGYTRSDSDALFFDYGFMLPEFDEQITVWVVDAYDQPILIRGAKSGTEYWEGVSYSAYDYAINSLNSSVTSPKMKNLASAFLNYGGAARTYFSAPETATNSGDYETQLNNLEPYKLTITGTKPTGVTNVYINTFFEEDHTLRISFKLAEGKTKNDYTFQIDGENAKVYSLGDNKYAIEVNNIAAPNLADAHDFSISDGTATYTVKASALSYAYTSVKNGNTARKNLGVCMYDYFKKADEFFNENSQA